MYDSISFDNGAITVSGIDRLDLARSCACGQSFRWREEGGVFTLPAFGRVTHARMEGSALRLWPCAPEDAELWIRYFDLERDYASIEAGLLENSTLCSCVPYASGIRVFTQEPFETLITFIISANNNIGRIAGIVERLCALSGERAELDGREYSLFPTSEAVAALSVADLEGIGAGYRAPYIKDSAVRIAGGYDLTKLKDMPLDDARKEMMTFKGVGPKVADCVLLFALGHSDAFPVDVWIGRAMNTLYFGGESPVRAELEKTVRALGSESGIVQQYIFHYARETGLGKDKKQGAGT